MCLEPFVVKPDMSGYILTGWKDWDFIIPGRNFLFLSLANSLLQVSKKREGFIYLCSHRNEMGYLKNRDKSRYFFEKSADFFSLDSGKKIHTGTPFADYSKSEVISYWRRNWEKKFKISPYDTVTCYYEKGCGCCEACLKRATYLLAGGYEVDKKIKINPMKDPKKIIVNKWIPMIKNCKVARDNKLDFLIAIKKSIKIAPYYVRNFYENLSPQTLKAVERRLDLSRN